MMQTWTKMAVVAGLVGVGLTAVSLAVDANDQPANDKHAKFLARHPEADLDSDGAISQEEFRQFRASRGGGGPRADRPGRGRGGPGFGRPDPAKILKDHPDADTDGDGKLSPEEMRGFWRSQMEQHRKQLLADHPELDTDKDGTLSETELRAGKGLIAEHRLQEAGRRVLAEHPEADTDGDGKLSKEEFAAFRGSMPGGRGPMGHPRPEPGRLLNWVIDHFGEVDTDGSGELSKAELTKLKERLPSLGLGPGPFGAGLGQAPPGAGESLGARRAGPGKGGPGRRGGPGAGGPNRERLLQRFPEADTDNDGQLSDEEIKAFKEQRRGRGKGPKAGS